jgi:hypothetical protein
MLASARPKSKGPAIAPQGHRMYSPGELGLEEQKFSRRTFKGENMVRTGSMIRVFFVMALLCVGVMYAQSRPVNTVNQKVNPNIYAANAHILQAWDFIGVAQQQNNFDMLNYAATAKNLLVQASNDLNTAAKIADSK